MCWLCNLAPKGPNIENSPLSPGESRCYAARGDIHYVVTEHGIAYLHGKNVRERAMELISIAHPKFQPWLIEEAKKMSLIYKDQAFIPGKRGIPGRSDDSPSHKGGLRIFCAR